MFTVDVKIPCCCTGIYLHFIQQTMFGDMSGRQSKTPSDAWMHSLMGFIPAYHCVYSILGIVSLIYF